jgi:Predicted nucleotidyltransferase
MKDGLEVNYSQEHWKLFWNMRKDGINIIEKLKSIGLRSYLFGSLARGDVNEKSDIEIVVLEDYSIRVEMIEDLFYVNHKFIILSTPTSTPKGYICLDLECRIVISFHLTKLTHRDEEFYKFGGITDSAIQRVPGVNKKLKFVIPTKEGHIEEYVIGNEDRVSSILGVSRSIVEERISMIMRRKFNRRNGIFLKYTLSPSEDFRSAIESIMVKNKVFKKIIEES